MTTIKNIHKITDKLGVEKVADLEKLANLHLRNSNIEFKILGIDDDTLTVKTTQGKSLQQNYADQKTLITRTKELFSKFFTGDIKVHANVFRAAVVDVVDSTWIKDQMLKNGIKLKDIETATGVDKTNLSGYINDKRPMSQPIKAMFYYYFASLN